METNRIKNKIIMFSILLYLKKNFFELYEKIRQMVPILSVKKPACIFFVVVAVDACPGNIFKVQERRQTNNRNNCNKFWSKIITRKYRYHFCNNVGKRKSHVESKFFTETLSKLKMRKNKYCFMQEQILF